MARAGPNLELASRPQLVVIVETILREGFRESGADGMDVALLDCLAEVRMAVSRQEKWHMNALHHVRQRRRLRQTGQNRFGPRGELIAGQRQGAAEMARNAREDCAVIDLRLLDPEVAPGNLIDGLG